MARSRFVRRAATVATVLVSALAAWAAVVGDGGLVSNPTIGVAVQPNGAATTRTFMISTTGSSSVAVAQMVQDSAGCPDPALSLASYAGFTVGSSSPHTETMLCPATSLYGMRRCVFDAQASDTSVLTSFMGVCINSPDHVLSANPSSWGFTNVPLGMLSAPKTIQIMNGTAAVAGTLQLQLDNDLANDYVLGSPCSSNVNGCDVPLVAIPINGSISVTVYCKPTTMTPPPANLWVTLGSASLPSPVSLTCAVGAGGGSAVISVSTMPSPLDVGPVEVTGTHTATGHVYVQNIGTQTLTIPPNGIAITGAGTDWTYALSAPCMTGQACDIPMGQTNDITVTFDPSAIGTRNATMQITSNATNGQQTVPLDGIGLGATLEDLTDPSTVDFGLVPKNMTSQPIRLHLDNRGNRDLTDATITLSNPTNFSVNTTNPVTVSYTTGKDVLVTCSPMGSTSEVMTTLTAMAPDTVNNMPVTITLTCTGTAAALVAIPGSVALGEIRTGSSPAPTSIDLKNVSTSSLMLTSGPMLMPPVPALALTPPASQTIPGGGKETIKLTVTTTADGDLTTSIVASDDNSEMLTIPVTGKVVTAAASVPSSVDLGTFCVNQPTTPTTIALTASGTGKISLPDAPALQMMGNSQFSLTTKMPSTYPATLAPMESALVDVKPKTQTMRGPVADMIDWSTDVPNNAMPTTMVSAMFLDDGAAIAPASLDFGQVPVHLDVHDAMSVTIQNCSVTPLALTPAIDPPFNLDIAEFPQSLMPGQTATFGVSFLPTKVMPYTGSLHVMTSPTTQQVLTVALSGEGIAGDMGGDGGPGSNGLDQTSFYACSCTSSGPGGALPIAAAFLLVTLRRRRGSSSAR